MNDNHNTPSSEDLDLVLANFIPEEEPVPTRLRHDVASYLRRNSMAAGTSLVTTQSVTDAIRPTFKVDEVGQLILRFDVLKTALANKDTPELRKDLASYINAMMTTARALLVSDQGLIRKNLVRLEAAGVNVALCPAEDGDGYLLVLHAQQVSFTRRVYLRTFNTVH